MSLPSLLRHVGVHVPRGITINGRVVAGAAAQAAVASGTATWLSPHTFHGGEQLIREVGDLPWWTDPDARTRDVRAVESAFPHFRLDDSGGGYRWRGVIDTGRGRFEVELVGRPDGGLPVIAPAVPRRLGRPEGRRFRKPDHLYTNGSLCVAGVDDWRPGEHTTATAIAWAAHWYAAYTDWRMCGVWPTDGFRGPA